MRRRFYRKVILSASPRSGSYAAMLILETPYSVPAFATAEDPVWRLAPSRDGVEDAIHHDGRFYSVTFSGVVEAWDRDGNTGKFTSKVVACKLPRKACNKLPGPYDNIHRRKYLATTLDGRLMVILKDSTANMPAPALRYRQRRGWTCVFKVKVLDEAKGLWMETADICDAALFVRVNGSLCVSTREHPGIRAGCVYYADDELGQVPLRMETSTTSYRSFEEGDDLRDLAVYNLRDGTVEKVEGIGRHPCWPPPAWFTPSL